VQSLFVSKRLMAALKEARSLKSGARIRTARRAGGIKRREKRQKEKSKKKLRGMCLVFFFYIVINCSWSVLAAIA